MSRKRADGQSSMIFNKSDRRWHGYVTVGAKPGSTVVPVDAHGAA